MLASLLTCCGTGLAVQDASPLPSSQVTATAPGRPDDARASNFRALRAATLLLEAAGVREVVENEPPHGSVSASMGGLWEGRPVFASADPAGAFRPLVADEEVVDRHQVLETLVQVVSSGDRSSRRIWFLVEGYAWSVGVFDDSMETTDIPASLRLVHAMLSQLQCPSDCASGNARGSTPTTGPLPAEVRRIASAFLTFASSPGRATASALPLSPLGVELGLGSLVLEVLPAGRRSRSRVMGAQARWGFQSPPGRVLGH